ncbi:MAG: MarR family transcriptional regulator [Symbiobacteriaceae bacterium]|nr:MarR family transcriptional regulator [Symbiobacteriaceae bacterium]
MQDKRIAIGELWREVNHGVHDRFRQAYKDPSLPFGMLIMLRQISKEPGITVSEMARRSGLAKSHISKQIDLLDSRGLVEKRPDPQDQRLLRLYLTKAAEEAAAELERVAQQAWLQVVGELADDEVDAVFKGFQLLRDALERSKRKTEQR